MSFCTSSRYSMTSWFSRNSSRTPPMYGTTAKAATLRFRSSSSLSTLRIVSCRGRNISPILLLRASRSSLIFFCSAGGSCWKSASVRGRPSTIGVRAMPTGDGCRRNPASLARALMLATISFLSWFIFCTIASRCLAYSALSNASLRAGGICVTRRSMAFLKDAP